MILGIHDGHDAGAALIDGKNIHAVNEERINREKYYRGFPELSIKEILEISDRKPKDIDYIAVSGNYRKRKKLLKLKKEIKNLIGTPTPRIINVEHHLAHAASTYFTSGWKNCIVLTLDAAGDGLSSGLYIGKNGKLSKFGQSSYLDSLGDFYASITEMLGFKPMRHEGKIMALGAYGDRTDYYDFNDCIEVQDLSFNNNLEVTGSKSAQKISNKINFPINRRKETSNVLIKGKMGHQLAKKAIKIAASGQKHLEDLLDKLTQNILDTEITNGYDDKIAVAGGVAQNFKGNKVFKTNFPDYWIFPHMGDGGLALGAALYVNSNINDKNISWDMKNDVRNVYLGSKFSDKEILETLDAEKEIEYYKSSNLGGLVSDFLLDDEIVCLFQGRMEYGPRALGNRSILADPSALNNKERLNSSLGREPFQPFAPSILEEFADDYLVNPDNNRLMTMSYKVTDKGEKDLAAAIHVDNSCRPQIVMEKENSDYFDLIKSFEEKSGVGAVLNTSFNMHGEPIVRTPKEALDSFKRSGLDALILENYVVRKKK